MIFMFAQKKWLRHTAMVPKGFIRYHVLEMLNEKPRSGSEIMSEIENHTGGFWKPSPGSIYPLLARLQEKGYINELSAEDGLKRYELTNNGKMLLDEQEKVRRKFRQEAGFLPGSFFDSFLMKIPAEKAAEIQSCMKRLGVAIFHLGSSLEKKYSEQILDESLGVVNETSNKLEKINEKLKGEMNE
jgi:DNA-binding PadR family transcriptional regulator